MQRHKIPQHFTASAVVICHEHILLVHHHRIGAWVPPGGHIEEGEMPNEAAVREVLEETGVPVKAIMQPPVLTADPDAFFLEPPLCIHGVKAVEQGQELYHVDIAYLCLPAACLSEKQPCTALHGDNLPKPRSGSDVKEAQWFKLSQLNGRRLAKNVPEVLDLALERLAQLGLSHHGSPIP